MNTIRVSIKLDEKEVYSYYITTRDQLYKVVNHHVMSQMDSFFSKSGKHLRIDLVRVTGGINEKNI